ncbi:MAG: bifunctional 4-hydroxy-2-oxoglutarate aldolase/2-dehydro-3-deoxy-phosphogluconate aldolase [Lachnospirales bacterium]
MNIYDEIQKFGVIPVVVIDRVEDAKALGQALIDGGLPCAEVTFRTDAAEEAMKVLSREFPDMLLGAGTVLNAEQVDRAINAGAKFIVSPGFNPNTVKYCIEKNIPILPGVESPSQIEQAIEFGLDVVKFFPAEQAGGIKKLSAMSAPYVNMRFMPTGGINAGNINSYLSNSKVLACGGSWMVKGDLIKEGKFDEIAKLTKEAVLTTLGFKIVHFGINSKDEAEAKKAANLFATLFGFGECESSKSLFTGSESPYKDIEIMKMPYFGTHGHIAIGTSNASRAKSYLEDKGITFKEETATYKNGRLTFIYLDIEIGGFAIHLLEV